LNGSLAGVGYESFRYLDMALRGERVFQDKGWYEGLVYEGGIGGVRFSSAQHMRSLGPARLMAKRVDLKDRRKLLDVGGGSGAYSIAFCNANPQLSATILDFPQTVDTAKRYAREAGLADRITNLAGNAVTADWPGGHDVILMSYVWSAVGEVDVAVLAKRAAAALRRGACCSCINSWLTTRARVRDLRRGICRAACSTIPRPFVSRLLTSSVSCVMPGSGFKRRRPCCQGSRC